MGPLPSRERQGASGSLLKPAIFASLRWSFSFYTCFSLWPLLSNPRAGGPAGSGPQFPPLEVQKVGLHDLPGTRTRLSSVTWGMVGLPGDKDVCVPPPRLGRDRPSQMCASPLSHQLLRLGPLLRSSPPPPRVAGPQQAGRQGRDLRESGLMRNLPLHSFWTVPSIVPG